MEQNAVFEERAELNVALCWHVNDERRLNHIIYIDPYYRYFVPFRGINSQELISSSFYLAIYDRGRRIERIKCQLTYLVFHLSRYYYKYEALRRNERDRRKIENFTRLLSSTVNPSLKNGSLLLSPLPVIALTPEENDSESE